MANLNFQTFDDPEDQNNAQLNEPVPKGDYYAKVVDSAVKTTKSGTGQYVELVWELNGHVDTGACKNRKIWQRINHINNNPEAQRIGKQQLNRVVKAFGLAEIDSSTELHGREVIVGVKITPAEGQYAASNDISYVKSKKHAPKKGNLSAAEIGHAANAPQTPAQSPAPSASPSDDPIPF